MTLVDGWYDWANREPGPPDRIIYPGGNNLSVLIAHSMEGRRGEYNVMFDLSRFPAAWHATVAEDGTLWQHYAVQAGLAASNLGNLRGPGIEAEGFAGTPLTDAQVDAWLHLIRDTEAATGRKYRPGVYQQGLTEHNMWGATECPSGRYQPLYDAIAAGKLENNVSIDELIKRLERLELASFAGGEQARAGLNQSERLAYAAYQIARRVDGEPGDLVGSIADVVASVQSNLHDHMVARLP